jgi:hypothetical protein
VVEIQPCAGRWPSWLISDRRSSFAAILWDVPIAAEATVGLALQTFS